MSLSEATPIPLSYDFNSAFEQFTNQTRLDLPEIGCWISPKLDRQYRLSQCCLKTVNFLFFIGKIAEVTLIYCALATSIPGVTFAAVVLGIGLCSPTALAYLTECGLVYHALTTHSPLTVCAAVVLGIGLYYFSTIKDALSGYYWNPDRREELADNIAKHNLDQLFSTGHNYVVITAYDLLSKVIKRPDNRDETYQKIARLYNAFCKLRDLRESSHQPIQNALMLRSSAITLSRQDIAKTKEEIEKKVAANVGAFNPSDLQHVYLTGRRPPALLAAQEQLGDTFFKGCKESHAAQVRAQQDERDYARWFEWHRSETQKIEAAYTLGIARLNALWKKVVAEA